MIMRKQMLANKIRACVEEVFEDSTCCVEEAAAHVLRHPRN